jgi:hypothetical protein
MNHHKLDEADGDLDDFLIDVDVLMNQSNGPDDASLDRIAGTLEDERDAVDDLTDSEV